MKIPELIIHLSHGDDRFRWRLVHGNGKILAASSQGFKSKGGAVTNFKRTRKAMNMITEKLLKKMSRAVFVVALMLGCMNTNAIDFTNKLHIDSTLTNVVFVPYAKYDIDTKDWGLGGAALYRVNDNFYAGFRYDDINHQQTTAGVQATLQDTFTINWIQVTPFVTSSTGLGGSLLYASAGPGMYVGLYSHEWKGTHPVKLSIGIMGDYEYVVNSNQANTHQVNVGPVLNIIF